MNVRALAGLLMMSCSPAFAAPPAAPTPAPPPACTAPEYRQFDFWVGRWHVVDAKSGEAAGESLIEKLYGGCALRENWSEPGFTGGSLNIYSASDQTWHQTWVDAAGALREFSGGLVDGKMVLVAHAFAQNDRAKPVLVRLSYTANADGTVRQYSDYSKDGGKTWAFRYDYLYKPAKD